MRWENVQAVRAKRTGRGSRDLTRYRGVLALDCLEASRLIGCEVYPDGVVSQGCGGGRMLTARGVECVGDGWRRTKKGVLSVTQARRIQSTKAGMECC